MMNTELNGLTPEENEALQETAVPEESAVPTETSEETETQAETSEETEVLAETPAEKPKQKNGKFFAFLRTVFPTRADSRKKILLKSVALLACVVFIFSAVYLSVYFIDLNNQNGKIDTIRRNYNIKRDDYSYNEDGQFSKFDELKTQNPDIVGWISITNTEVDNPVYQTINNDYYITHDMNRASNSYGALFLDYRSDINPMSLTQNQIIYGHNMRYGAMFGTLKEYRTLDFYKQNPLISFDSLYESRTYKIFAVMIVNDSEDDTFSEVYGGAFSAYRPVFTNQEQFMLWVAQCRARSLFDTTVDVQPYDEVLTLSTCCYDYTDARFVLVGRLVRDGETAEVDTEGAAVNTDVIYSKEYYKKKGWSVPSVEPPVLDTNLEY